MKPNIMREYCNFYDIIVDTYFMCLTYCIVKKMGTNDEFVTKHARTLGDDLAPHFVDNENNFIGGMQHCKTG